MIDIVPEGISKISWEYIKKNVAQDKEAIQYLRELGLEDPAEATRYEIVRMIAKLLNTLESDEAKTKYIIQLKASLQTYVSEFNEDWQNEDNVLAMIYVVPDYKDERAKKAHKLLMFYLIQYLQQPIKGPGLFTEKMEFIDKFIESLREMIFNTQNR
ncbi:hypothetical protein [Saccharolobus sp.]|uniref:hypothetical protein n=1 Tax=Saccharolobus sp. TaxID=2100761 RepID=UPI0027AA5A90|nr:hypothetical protein [Sulfolobus tengchongensis spindle-shaped virus 4]